MTSKDEMEHYELYRCYVRHEDNLINHRLTWYILGQTVTLTSLGYFLSQTDGLAQVSRLLNIWPAWTLIYICLIGIAIAAVTIVSITAADRAIASLKVSYNKTMLPLAGLPNITGGGMRLMGRLGSILHFAIPGLGLIFWVVIALRVFYNFDAINSKTRHDVDRSMALEDAQMRYHSAPTQPNTPDASKMK